MFELPGAVAVDGRDDTLGDGLEPTTFGSTWPPATAGGTTTEVAARDCAWYAERVWAVDGLMTPTIAFRQWPGTPQ